MCWSVLECAAITCTFVGVNSTRDTVRGSVLQCVAMPCSAMHARPHTSVTENSTRDAFGGSQSPCV